MSKLAALLAVFALLACGEPTAPAAPSQASSPVRELAIITMADGGEIHFRFLPEHAPRHVENFKKLARAGFYDGTTFHRVIEGFMIQGGDANTKDANPANDGTGNAGYRIDAEFNPVRHVRGVVSMARSKDVNSASSQFFIMVADNQPDGVSWGKVLDGKYSAFGEVVAGMDVADRIATAERDLRDRPKTDQRVTSVRIEPAL